MIYCYVNVRYDVAIDKEYIILCYMIIIIIAKTVQSCIFLLLFECIILPPASSTLIWKIFFI